MYTNYKIFKENLENTQNDSATFSSFIDNVIDLLEEDRYFSEYDEDEPTDDGEYFTYDEMIENIKEIIKQSLEELNMFNIAEIDANLLAHTILSNDYNMFLGEDQEELQEVIDSAKNI